MLRLLLIQLIVCGLTVMSAGMAVADAARVTQVSADVKSMPVPPAPVTAPAWLVTGQLVSIDRNAGTATIRHPRLPIGVPATTTVFRIAEPMFIEQMKSARKVRFSAARIDGMLTITHLEVPRQ